MMTQTHLLVALALFAKPRERLRNTAIVIGALVPDAAIYGLFAWSKFAGIPERRVWDELYWQEPWQTLVAAGNSIPIHATMFVLALVALRMPSALHRVGMVLFFLSLAALVHIACDLPVHNSDAHRHFWPLSDWKFISPVSYWQPAFHGNAFQIFEAILGPVLAVVLFRRFNAWWVRALLVLAVLAYIAVPVYFNIVLGDA